MSFRPCTREDPFVKKVRTKYRANVVLAPRAGIDPLQVVARKGSIVQVWGSLRYILADPMTYDPPPVRTVPAAEIEGQMSTNVDVGLAAELSSKFLSALGVPIPGAELNANIWSGANGFAFEVRDVTSREVDIAHLGHTLDGHRIARNSPGAQLFVNPLDPAILHIITRTLNTSHVAIRATSHAGSDVEAKVDGIEDILGKASAKVSVQRESKSTVSFKGTKAVTFAVASVRCRPGLDASLSLVLDDTNITLFDEPGSADEPIRMANDAPIVAELGILDFLADEDAWPEKLGSAQK